jgi:hypothetical protein
LPDRFESLPAAGNGGDGAPFSMEVLEPPFNIEIIDLFHFQFHSKELLRVIPSKLSPHLHTLKLVSIKGLEADDMITFLTRVASTLCSLTLARCPFNQSSQSSPCYIIDQVMPIFVSLKELHVMGCPGSLTAASLRLKPTRVDGSWIRCHEIMDYNQIVVALVGSKWREVYLRTNEKETNNVDEAYRIATEEGIALNLDDWQKLSHG